jgi:transcriptional regulator with XRE-family HTH domain
MTKNKTIAEQVKELRGSLSQAALAELVGVSQPRIAEVEAGRNARLSTLVALARALKRELVVHPDAPEPLVDTSKTEKKAERAKRGAKKKK